MRTAKYYTFEDVSMANIIVGRPDLYPDSFIAWAIRVKRWWNTYCTIIKRYAIEMGHATLAVKAVWDNIKRGISVKRMLVDLLRPESKGRARYRHVEMDPELMVGKIRSKWAVHVMKRGQKDLAEARGAEGRVYRPESSPK